MNKIYLNRFQLIYQSGNFVNIEININIFSYLSFEIFLKNIDLNISVCSAFVNLNALALLATKLALSINVHYNDFNYFFI